MLFRSHCLCVTTNGDLFAMGSGDYGKLGQGSAAHATLPVRVAIPSPTGAAETLLSVAVGRQNSFALRHVPGYGTVLYAWGRNTEGSDETHHPTQCRVGVPADVVKLVGGPGSFFLLTASGEVVVGGHLPPPFGCSNGGASGADAVRGPKFVDTLGGKFVTNVAVGGVFAVYLCDDRRWTPGAWPELATRETMVPKARRAMKPPLTDANDPRIQQYETAVLNFFTGALGGDAAAAQSRFAAIPVASPLPKGPQLGEKRGARALHPGSKVRVWVSDVYALGVVERRLESRSANHFQVEWLREDWDPEPVELHSDDETLDGDNECRWQALWFTADESA